MRYILIFFLALIPSVVSVSRLAAEVVYVGGQRVIEPAVQDVPDGIKRMWYVLGYGQTEAEAKDDAITKSRDVINAYLKRQDGSFLYRPSPSYIKKKLIEGEMRREKDFDAELKVQGQPITGKWYSLPVGVSERDYRDLQKRNRDYVEQQLRLTLMRERDQRTNNRLMVLGKVGAFCLALCILAIGYIRLDERTKGYLSRWLGITAIGVLVALAILLCFIN